MTEARASVCLTLTMTLVIYWKSNSHVRLISSLELSVLKKKGDSWNMTLDQSKQVWVLVLIDLESYFRFVVMGFAFTPAPSDHYPRADVCTHVIILGASHRWQLECSYVVFSHRGGLVKGMTYRLWSFANSLVTWSDSYFGVHKMQYWNFYYLGHEAPWRWQVLKLVLINLEPTLVPSKAPHVSCVACKQAHLWVTCASGERWEGVRWWHVWRA